MQYSLKSAKAKGVPYTKEKVYGIDVIIQTKIVGQTYSGFENMDVAFCPVEGTDSIDKTQQKIDVFAVEFVKKKYPETK